MSGVLAIGAVVVMSCIPALLFIGLWAGLKRLQEQAFLDLVEVRSDAPVKEVTIGDAFRGALGLQDDYTERDLLEKP